jgi:glycosyltransferase involved in cell wall biosynthesis
MRIAHVIPNLYAGGASRSLEWIARTLIDAGDKVSVLSLAGGWGAVGRRLSSFGVSRSDGSDLGDHDVVIVHFWNTPAMYRFLRAPHPPMRVVMWLKVEGGTRPHVVTPELAEFADVILASSTSSLSLSPVKQRPADYVSGAIELAQFKSCQVAAETPFAVGYFGTVDFSKMHPDFVAMSCAVPDEDISFDVWGPGTAYKTLKAEAVRLGQEHRFKFHGVTGDAAAAFASMHVYGYPLCEDTYAATDRTLQEAMASGLPCAVLDRPGLRDLAIDGITALIAKSPREYTAAVTRLKQDRELRKRLGQNAQGHIQLHFDPSRLVTRYYQTLTNALLLPKRDRPGADSSISGARLFVASLGSLAGEYACSLRSFDDRCTIEDQVLDDEEAISTATPGLCNSGAGGIFNYRAAYPDDPVLRFWCGLIFSRQGRHAVALAEFLAALRLGLPSTRIEPRVAREARCCGLSEGAMARYFVHSQGTDSA